MLTLRSANAGDCQQYFDWANDKIVRKNAFNQKIIDWEAHQKWFKNKLNDKNSFLYVAQEQENTVGQIRFDCYGSKAIISYSIANSFRGIGLGKAIIRKTIEKIHKEYLNIDIIESRVKFHNIASRKIFLGLNFDEQSRAEQSR